MSAKQQMKRRSFASHTLVALACLLVASTPLHARTHRRHRAARTTSTPPISAIFLSDIHFDPLRDPVKAPRLDAAPVDQWAAILASPDSPTRDADYAAINARCPIKPLVDPDDRLFHSALDAIHSQARTTHARFAVLGGDLIGHQYDCRYNLLFPKATHAQFLAFVLKTEEYVISNLRTALPSIPIYITYGNDDTGCHDNSLSPHDDFLSQAASLAADTLPGLDQAAALRTFPRGYYAASLPVPHTRILVLDDVYQMATYKTCTAQANPSAPPDPAAEAGQDAQLAWLATQLKQIHHLHQQAWVLAHVPPGVNVWSSYNGHPDICAGSPPTTFLDDDKLNDLLAANADIVRLALFGHSHTDELRLLKPANPSDSTVSPTAGVPVKILPSISPVFSELPSFTLAKIDPRTATLKDYSVIMASNSTGLGATWAPTYTFSDTYHLPDFSSDSLTQLITLFQSDPKAEKPESQAYEREYRHYFFDDHSTRVSSYWPAYVCATDHISAASFIPCACAAK
jgi:sphingomyelin phosphodiesterase acid-like 3